MPRTRTVLTLLAAIPFVSLAAQDAGKWIPVIHSVPEGVEVVARMVPTSRGVQVEFRNRGTRPIHFEFHLPGSQSPRDAETNKRVHLRPGKSSGTMEFPSPDHGAQGPLASLKIQHIRYGVDAGAFWRK